LICSYLAPGQDGVGDYTRGLARNLEECGHSCLLISLNEAESAGRDSGPEPFDQILRLSNSASWQDRIEQAAEAVHSFKADWISLQFVCYGLHPKGLVFGLARKLAAISTTARWQIMLHELWIGESQEYGMKDRVVGFLQKLGVLQVLRRIAPSVVHTSNPTYVELLERNGVSARELPLPGNIPIATGYIPTREEFLGNRMSQAGTDGAQDCWIAGVFGTIHPQWCAGEWLDSLCRAAKERRCRLMMVHFGRSSGPGLALWNRLARDYADRCHFTDLGEMPSEKISAALQALDFGIATSPWALIGKSGSTAAMLEHGIPVAVTRNDWQFRRGVTPEPSPHPLLFPFGEPFLRRLTTGFVKSSPQSRWPEVTKEFLSSLRSIEEPSMVPAGTGVE
jgi:hypothetical protein